MFTKLTNANIKDGKVNVCSAEIAVFFIPD
jgi:hypothetical protein